MKENKFNFYDIVKIVSEKSSLKKVNNNFGIIRGMSQNEETGEWGYGVLVCNDENLAWDILESDLQSTGKKANSDTYNFGKIVKVSVDPETNKGGVMDDEEKND